MAKRFIGNVKGVGVSDFSWEYYLSSSSAVLDGGSWSATPPTLGNNKYLWMRSKVTLTDGSIQYTVPVCEGVWEEIYGIYAIGDKVDGALSDVTDLKSRMTAEEGKIQPLSKGGTGKTTRAAAMNYMQYIQIEQYRISNEVRYCFAACMVIIYTHSLCVIFLQKNMLRCGPYL